PRGGMAMDFWNAQMECNPSKAPSLESRFLDCRHLIAKTIEARGKTVFKHYEGPDKYVEKILRIPLYDEHAEFQACVLILSRIFIEYLDEAGFKAELDEKFKKDKDGKTLGSIVLFANWLELILGVDSPT